MKKISFTIAMLLTYTVQASHSDYKDDHFKDNSSKVKVSTHQLYNGKTNVNLSGFNHNKDNTAIPRGMFLGYIKLFTDKKFEDYNKFIASDK